MNTLSICRRVVGGRCPQLRIASASGKARVVQAAGEAVADRQERRSRLGAARDRTGLVVARFISLVLLGHSAAFAQTLDVDNNQTFSINSNASYSYIVAGDYESSGSIEQFSGTVTDSGTLDLGLNPQINGGYQLIGGVLNVAGQATLGYSGNGGFTQQGGTSTFSSMILGVVRSVNNIYQSSGVINLVGGTLSTNSIAAGAEGGILYFDGGTLRALSNSTAFVTANISLDGGQIDTNGYNVTIAHNIAPDLNTGVLTKLGAGTLVLSGTNTYTASTVVSAGTLQFAQAASLYNSSSGSLSGSVTASNLAVQSGATAAFNVGGSGEFSLTEFLTLAGLGTASGGFESGSAIGIDTTNAPSAVAIGTNLSNPNGGANALGFTKLGAGKVALSGANSYTGPTTVGGGVLQFATAASLYNSTGSGLAASVNESNLIVQNGATAAFNVGGSGEFSAAEVASLAGLGTASGGFTNGSAIGIDTSNATGVVAISASLGNPNGGANSLGLMKLGAGTLALSGNNSYTGGTTISGGILNVGSSNALGATSAITFAGGTLQYSAANQVDYSALFSTAANQSYSIDTNGQNVTLASALTSSGGTLTKLGTGTLTLTGNNSYTGGTVFSGGLLNLGSAGALGATGTLTFNGGTLQYSAANQVDYSARFSNAANQAYSIDTNGQNITLASVLSSSGGTLTKLGAGTLTLSGANTYSGGTNVTAGQLTITGSIAAQNTTIGPNATVLISGTLYNDLAGAITIQPGGTLNAAQTTNNAHTFNTMNLDGATVTSSNSTDPEYGNYVLFNSGSPATINVTQSTATPSTLSAGQVQLNGSTTFNVATGAVFNVSSALTDCDFSGGVFQHQGILTKSGGGTAVLTGTNSYTGTTTISGGILQFGKAASLYNSSTGSLSASVNVSHLIVQSGGTAAFNVGGTNEFSLAEFLTLAALGTASGGFENGASIGIDTTNATGGVTIGTNLTNTNGGANVLGLTKLGAGTLTLSVSQSYTGPTTVLGGQLKIMGSLASVTNIIGPNASILIAGTLYNDLGSTVAIQPGGVLNAAQTTDNAHSFYSMSLDGGTVTSSNSTDPQFGNYVLFTHNGTPGTITVTQSTATASTLSATQVQFNGNVILNVANGAQLNASSALTDWNFTGGAYQAHGSLTKTGAGTATLTGTNTYTGGTALNGGVLNAGSTGALPATGAISFGGGTLQYSAANQIDYSSRFSTAANQAYRIDTNGQNVTFASNLTSSGGSLSKLGAGTLTLTGNNTYSCGTAINGGTVLINSGNALGGAPGGVTFNGGTLEAGATFAASGNITLNAGGGTIQVDAGTLTMNGSLSGTGSLTKTGGGTLNLSAPSGSYSGNVDVNGGALLVNSDSALGAASGGVIFNGGALETGSTFATARSITLNSAGGTFQVDSGTLTVHTAITGAGGLTKTGAGTLNLTGANSYTGTTNVNGGTVVVSGSISGSTVQVNNGGTFAGNGSVNVNSGLSIFVNSGGTLAPSKGGLYLSRGPLLFSGSTLQLSMANNQASSGGAPSFGDYSVMTVGDGEFALGGSLVTDFDGPLNNGDLFPIIINNGVSIQGAFSNPQTPAPNSAGSTYRFTSNGLLWDINYAWNGRVPLSNVDPFTFEQTDDTAFSGLTSQVALLLIQVPEPGSWNCLLTGGGLLLGWGRYRRRS